jgi:hypothetical protein
MPTPRSAWWSRSKRGRVWKISTQILAVEGVDAVFIGPADLAASLGHLGEAGHPEVRAAIEDALRRIAARQGGRRFRHRPALAAHYRDLVPVCCRRRRHHAAAQCGAETGRRFPR